MFFGFGLVIMVACVVFFYKAAEMDDAPGFLWAGMSLLVWYGTGLLMPRAGLLAHVGGQVALFFGIAVFRVMRDLQKK
jgi:hypothetical protein